MPINKIVIDVTDAEWAFRERQFPDVSKALKKVDLSKCTVCSKGVRDEDLYCHPVLKVLLCKACHKFYTDGEFSTDEDGEEKYCRWCGDGGDMYGCNECPLVFCKKCVKTNFGRKLVKDLERDDWKCFVCDVKPLWEARAYCWAVIEARKDLTRRIKEKNRLALERLGTKKLVSRRAPSRRYRDSSSSASGSKSEYSSRELRKKKQLRRRKKDSDNDTDHDSDSDFEDSKSKKDVRHHSKSGVSKHKIIDRSSSSENYDDLKNDRKMLRSRHKMVRESEKYNKANRRAGKHQTSGENSDESQHSEPEESSKMQNKDSLRDKQSREQERLHSINDEKSEINDKKSTRLSERDTNRIVVAAESDKVSDVNMESYSEGSSKQGDANGEEENISWLQTLLADFTLHSRKLTEKAEDAQQTLSGNMDTDGVQKVCKILYNQAKKAVKFFEKHKDDVTVDYAEWKQRKNHQAVRKKRYSQRKSAGKGLQTPANNTNDIERDNTDTEMLEDQVDLSEIRKKENENVVQCHDKESETTVVDESAADSHTKEIDKEGKQQKPKIGPKSKIQRKSSNEFSSGDDRAQVKQKPKIGPKSKVQKQTSDESDNEHTQVKQQKNRIGLKNKLQRTPGEESSFDNDKEQAKQQEAKIGPKSKVQMKSSNESNSDDDQRQKKQQKPKIGPKSRVQRKPSNETSSDDDQEHTRPQRNKIESKSKVQRKLSDEPSSDNDQSQSEQQKPKIGPKSKVGRKINNESSSDNDQKQRKQEKSKIGPKSKVQRKPSNETSSDDDQEQTRPRKNKIEPKSKVQRKLSDEPSSDNDQSQSEQQKPKIGPKSKVGRKINNESSSDNDHLRSEQQKSKIGPKSKVARKFTDESSSDNDLSQSEQQKIKSKVERNPSDGDDHDQATQKPKVGPKSKVQRKTINKENHFNQIPNEEVDTTDKLNDRVVQEQKEKCTSDLESNIEDSNINNTLGALKDIASELDKKLSTEVIENLNKTLDMGTKSRFSVDLFDDDNYSIQNTSTVCDELPMELNDTSDILSEDRNRILDADTEVEISPSHDEDIFLETNDSQQTYFENDKQEKNENNSDAIVDSNTKLLSETTQLCDLGTLESQTKESIVDTSIATVPCESSTKESIVDASIATPPCESSDTSDELEASEPITDGTEYSESILIDHDAQNKEPPQKYGVEERNVLSTEQETVSTNEAKSATEENLETDDLYNAILTSSPDRIDDDIGTSVNVMMNEDKETKQSDFDDTSLKSNSHSDIPKVSESSSLEDDIYNKILNDDANVSSVGTTTQKKRKIGPKSKMPKAKDNSDEDDTTVTTKKKKTAPRSKMSDRSLKFLNAVPSIDLSSVQNMEDFEDDEQLKAKCYVALGRRCRTRKTSLDKEITNLVNLGNLEESKNKKKKSTNKKLSTKKKKQDKSKISSSDSYSEIEDTDDAEIINISEKVSKPQNEEDMIINAILVSSDSEIPSDGLSENEKKKQKKKTTRKEVKSEKDVRKEKINSDSEDEFEDKGKKKKSAWRNAKELREPLSESDTSDEDVLFAKIKKRQNNDKSGSDDEIRVKSKRLKTVNKARQRVFSDSDAVIISSGDNYKVDDSSDDDSSDVFITDSKKNKRIKRKHSSASSDDSASSEPKKKVNKRRRIRKPASDSSSDGGVVELNESQKTEGGTPGKRKNIRKVLKGKDLEKATQDAAKEEAERRKRIAQRQLLYNQMFEDQTVEGQSQLKELILDFDEKTKEPIIQVHKKLVAKLKPHQAQGVKFMWDVLFESVERAQKSKGSGCILAHCMGLGKTLQVITLIHTLLTNEDLKLGIKTVLVVTPLSTVNNWCQEFRLWLHDIDDGDEVQCFNFTHARPNERSLYLKNWQRHGGVAVMGYDMFRNLCNTAQSTNKRISKTTKETYVKCLLNPGPDLVVCDEGHMLKNEKSKLSQCMNEVRTLRRVALTGTPLQNNLLEYHCMIQFVKPNLLGTKKEFTNRFVNPIKNGQCADSTERDVFRMKKRAHVLHTMLGGCVQRYDYSVLTPLLKPKHEYVIKIRLTEIQVKMYEHYLHNFARQTMVNKGASLFSDYQNLQRIWTHPLTMKFKADRVTEQMDREGAEEEDSEGSLKNFIDDDDVSDTSSSSSSSSDSDVMLCDGDDKVNDAKDEKRKMKEKKNDTKRYRTRGAIANGEVAEEEKENELQEQRTEWWHEYVSDDDLDNLAHSNKLVMLFSILKECEAIGDKIARLFLISTRAGGLGINMVGANRVILFDASWNPSNDMQSIFRVYRFGQQKPCYIYRFLAAGTMEEKIYDRQVTKLALAGRVVDEHQIDRHYNAADLEELYTFTPPCADAERPTMLVPKDRLLAEMLKEHQDLIEGYLEHDSLLENKPDENLTEAERQSAWEDYEHEKNMDEHRLLIMEQHQAMQAEAMENAKLYQAAMAASGISATDLNMKLALDKLNQYYNQNAATNNNPALAMNMAALSRQAASGNPAAQEYLNKYYQQQQDYLRYQQQQSFQQAQQQQKQSLLQPQRQEQQPNYVPALSKPLPSELSLTSVPFVPSVIDLSDEPAGTSSATRPKLKLRQDLF